MVEMSDSSRIFMVRGLRGYFVWNFEYNTSFYGRNDLFLVITFLLYIIFIGTLSPSLI